MMLLKISFFFANSASNVDIRVELFYKVYIPSKHDFVHQYPMISVNSQIVSAIYNQVNRYGHGISTWYVQYIL